MVPFLIFVFVAPFGFTQITVSEAAELLAEEESLSVAFNERMVDEPLTALRAATLLWQGSNVPRRRFWAFLGWEGGLWEEAVERGWFEPQTPPESFLNEAQFREAWKRSRKETQIWNRDGLPRWWDWSLTLSFRTNLEPPESAGLSFRTWNLLGLSLGGPEHGLTLEVGSSLSWRVGTPIRWRGDGILYFSPTLKKLWYTFTLEPPPTWYQSMSLDLGRFSQGEASGLVYGQTLDGLRLKVADESFQAFLQAGYSGFISKEDGVPLITPGDVTDSQNKNNPFGPPRFLSALSFRHLPWSWLVWDAALVAHNDLGGRVTPARVVSPGATLFTPYEGGLYRGTALSLALEWMPIESLNAFFAGAFQFAETLNFSVDQGQYFSMNVRAFAIRTRWAWYLGEWETSASGFFSTGDGSIREIFLEGSRFFHVPAFSGLYKSWGAPGPGSFFQVGWGNLAGGGLQGIWQPGFLPEESLSLRFSAQAFFRPNVGPVSDTRVRIEPSGSHYLGTEGNLAVEWNPWAETFLGLTAGFFLPNRTGAFPASEDALFWGVSLEGGWQF